MFDKTFFKFALGFVVIIGFSFGVLFSIGYFDQSSKANQATNLLSK